MTGNVLYEPLGTKKDAKPRPSRGRRVAYAVIAAGIALCVAVPAWLGWHRSGPAEGVVVATLPMPVRAPQPVSKPAEDKTGSIPAAAVPPAVADATASGGVRIVRPPGSPNSQGAFIEIPQSPSLRRAPDARLVEKSRYGALPRRGSDGARAATVYARPAPATQGARLALFVGGMGLNSRLTKAAAAALPPDVTLGFAPYGGDLDSQVAQAREFGHEVVLQVPMESFNEPDDATMPRILSTKTDAKQVLDDLHWHMGRFVGYAGVSNFLGAKFTADASGFTPVLREVGERGLFYLDDGSAPRSLAPSLAQSAGVPVVRADLMIDALGEPAAIDAGLKKLAALAKDRGFAIGATTGLPTTVDALAAFVKALPAQGITLVPISAFASADTKSVAR